MVSCATPGHSHIKLRDKLHIQITQSYTREDLSILAKRPHTSILLQHPLCLHFMTLQFSPTFLRLLSGLVAIICNNYNLSLNVDVVNSMKPQISLLLRLCFPCFSTCTYMYGTSFKFRISTESTIHKNSQLFRNKPSSTVPPTAESDARRIYSDRVSARGSLPNILMFLVIGAAEFFLYIVGNKWVAITAQLPLL